MTLDFNILRIRCGHKQYTYFHKCLHSAATPKFLAELSHALFSGSMGQPYKFYIIAHGLWRVQPSWRHQKYLCVSLTDIYKFGCERSVSLGLKYFSILDSYKISLINLNSSNESAIFISNMDYTVEVMNGFMGLDQIDRVPEELRTDVHNIVQEVVTKTIPKKKKCKKPSSCLRRPYK